MRKGFQWRVLDVFSFFFFLFGGFSLENALNSKLCLHQDFWSLTILLAGWAGTAYGKPFMTVPLNPPLHFMVHRSIFCPINDFVMITPQVIDFHLQASIGNPSL